MCGNTQVRFLEGKGAVRLHTYSTIKKGSGISMKSLLYKYPITSSVVITIVTFIISIYLISQGIYYGLLLQIPAISVVGYIFRRGRNITTLKKIIFVISLTLIYSLSILYLNFIIGHSN
jgi:hypothetical protein